MSVPNGQHPSAAAPASDPSRARPGDWLAQVLDRRRHIDAAFAAVKGAATAEARRAAQQRLGLLLAGHSMRRPVAFPKPARP